MIYLLFSILASTTIFLVFKLFDRFKVNTLHAIVVNYITACISGYIDFGQQVSPKDLPDFPWFYYTLVLGALFIVVFNLMALTTQRSGMSVVSVATKMSLIIPIIFGLWYYKEGLGGFKLAGILCALTAVYLVSVRSNNETALKGSTLWLPALVFLGSGIIDTSLKFLEEAYVEESEVSLFSASIFGAAALIGIAVILLRLALRKVRFQLKDILGGIALGIPNYFSVFFLVKALRSNLLDGDSSNIFTVNNVLIVLLSTVLGIIWFRERLEPRNWMGIDLAVFSLFFFALTHIN